jgi:hypothetical protein
MTTTATAPFDLSEFSALALLDKVDDVFHRQREADVELIRLVAEFARQHGEGTVDPVSAQLKGRERAVRVGGDGTPCVAEFAPAVLAARLQLSPHAGRLLVADVLDLEHRLPQLWCRLMAGEVRVGHARFVARRTRELSPEEASYVDQQVAEIADGRLSWARFEAAVEAAIKAADPVTAAKREEWMARETFARATRSNEDGMRGFYVRADFATVARIDATVAFLAKVLLALGDGRSLDQRRVTAVLIMANPVQAVAILKAFQECMRDAGKEREWAPEPERFDPTALPDVLDPAKLLPTVVLFVHLAGLRDDVAPVARIEGANPVTAEWVRKHLGERCRFTIKPVVDPLNQTPVDAYEIPRRHREAVQLMTPADVFPFASNTTREIQIDHTEAYDEHGPPGQSRIGNYGPMTGFHHRVKTHGRWVVKQPFPGTYLWRDPYGAMYLVDHTGTRRVGFTLAS